MKVYLIYKMDDDNQPIPRIVESINTAIEVIRNLIGDDVLVDSHTDNVYYYPDELESVLDQGRIELYGFESDPVYVQRFELSANYYEK